MRIARQNKRLNPHIAIHIQLRQHLVRVADNCRAAARAGPTNAGPKVFLNKIAIAFGRGTVAQFGLPSHPNRLAIERAIADIFANFVIQSADQKIGGGARFGFGFIVLRRAFQSLREPDRA